MLPVLKSLLVFLAFIEVEHLTEVNAQIPEVLFDLLQKELASLYKDFDPTLYCQIYFPNQLLFLCLHSGFHSLSNADLLYRFTIVFLAKYLPKHMLLFLQLLLEVLNSFEGVVLMRSEKCAMRADPLLFSQTDDIHHHAMLLTKFLLRRRNHLRRSLLQQDFPLLLVNFPQSLLGRRFYLLQLESNVFIEGEVGQISHLMGFLAKLTNEYFLVFLNLLETDIADVVGAGERVGESGDGEALEALAALLGVFHVKNKLGYERIRMGVVDV